jgi:UDP-N-acetylglucosamine--N-acetylmuramyl-(pentapeptide) pyrophosphoryl-undecaprenol N-acetylglucosamine transferase
MKKKIKICITGGHLTPALAVIDEIQNVHPDWEVVFIGRTYALEQDAGMSKESKEIQRRGIRFFPITAGRLRRDISFGTLTAFLKIPIGFIQSFWYMLWERPQCILTFGGYVGLPSAISGWLLGIPVATHEQTHTLGIANRLLLSFIEVCLLSYEDTKYSPKEKSYLTGLPIRAEITHPAKTLSFSIPSGKPIIYITGGSTGAVSMNEILFPIIHTLVSYAVVIHQTGIHSIEKAEQIKQTLPEKYRNRYIPIPYIEGKDVGWIMHHMTLIVGRSGGNTVAEVAMVHKPAVFIPLPWSGQNEQEQNAQWYKKTHTAYIAHQEKDSSQYIQKSIASILRVKQKEPSVIKTNDMAAKTITGYIELLVNANEK